MSMRLLPTAMLLMLLTCPPATGQGIVLLDQIGAADASDINTFAMLQHQIHVLDDNSPWNTAVLDQFSNPDGASLTQVSIVIGGHSGYSGVDAIAGMRLAVFSSTDAAEQGGLVGDELWASALSPCRQQALDQEVSIVVPLKEQPL